MQQACTQAIHPYFATNAQLGDITGVIAQRTLALAITAGTRLPVRHWRTFPTRYAWPQASCRIWSRRLRGSCLRFTFANRQPLECTRHGLTYLPTTARSNGISELVKPQASSAAHLRCDRCEMLCRRSKDYPRDAPTACNARCQTSSFRHTQHSPVKRTARNTSKTADIA